ncbi:MAG: 4Fe-4S dicluster domain-containing protein [Pseudomonadota bacterium]
MFFTISLYLSLAICAAGLVYKIWAWLNVSVEKEDRQYSPGQRLTASLTEMARVVFSRRIGALLKALILDGFLQKRSLSHSFVAWLAHICLFTGFTGLLLLHALASQVTARLFDNYYATLDPWLFLRDLLGVLVLVGVFLIVYRRVAVRGLRQITRGADRLAIILLMVVLFSGFGLQALKITSARIFDRMQEEYAGLSQPQELQALRSVWAEDYGVVFAPGQISRDADVLALGQKLNEDSCVSCHSPAPHAFGSFVLSVVLRPVALVLDQFNATEVVYYLHFLSLFLWVALMPFSKFLHMFSGPLLLATNAVVDRQTMHPAARAALRALELDACSHCGTCTVHCSVAVTLHRIHNQEILPSERLFSLSAMVRGGNGDPAHLARVREGAYTCTNCYRCTRLCPLGINLNDLWAALKKNLIQAGLGVPYQEAAQKANQAAEESRHKEKLKVVTGNFQHGLKVSAQAGTFSSCYACRQCTNACPLVFMYEWPNQELDMLPHQVMYALGLGLKEEAMGSRMVWNCLTCYQCQEACPNSVQVTDILYELRYLAAQAASSPEA